MRVLGIDPALAGATGYGVVETDGHRCRPVRFGVLPARRWPRRARAGPQPASDEPGLAPRLKEIHSGIARLVAEYSPDALAIESVFTALNMKTALKLAEVRGVVMLAAAQSGIPVHSYSPREVKSRVAGYGNADKHQMQQMVRLLLNLSQAPEPADAADALAVALCHIQSAQARARLTAATGLTGLTPTNGKRSGSRGRIVRIQSPR
jgi:crossover junction endodeoxyribonuclease RuvC